ncbi:MAG: hypothetical protein HOY69_30335 [Streptomyces sp.]|nr:hypothetical protein [Streptomyces sp.]
MVRQRRRRPGLIALSVALIAAGGLSGAVLYSSSGQRTSVVVVARDVPIGAQITKADLTQASIALDPTVKAVKAGAESSLVGQRAAVDLKAGSLLSPAQVTRKTLVGPDEQLVGVSLKPNQLPATPLQPGQKVLVVSTPDPNAADAAGSKSTTDQAPPETLSATVVTVGDPATGTGTVTVDVAVPSGDGPALAARVATGNVALIVASRDGN